MQRAPPPKAYAAVENARAVRSALVAAGVEIAPLAQVLAARVLS